MSEFYCFYECCRCGTKHRGGVQTPDSVKMVQGAKKTEWVFVCEPPCQEPEKK